jgi:hypothetical protein
MCSSNVPCVNFAISSISVDSRCFDVKVMMVICSATVICRAKWSFHTRLSSSGLRSLPRAFLYLNCIGSMDCNHLRGVCPLCLMSSLKVLCIETIDLSFSQGHSFSMWLMISRAVNFIGSCPSISLSPACSARRSAGLPCIRSALGGYS